MCLVSYLCLSLPGIIEGELLGQHIQRQGHATSLETCIGEEAAHPPLHP